MEAKQYISKKPKSMELIKKEINKNYLETNENKNVMIQKLWDATRGTLTAIQNYLRKWEKRQINTLTLHLKQLEREKQKYQS